MGDTAVLVACGSSKRDGRNPSWSLYDSTLFEKSWAAAMLIGDPYVMSAKHGLLTADDRVDPYDAYLGEKTWDEKLDWARDVADDIPDHYETVVLMGGQDYVEPLEHVLDYAVKTPFEDCTGNGQQMAVAGDIAEQIMKTGDWE